MQFGYIWFEWVPAWVLLYELDGFLARMFSMGYAFGYVDDLHWFLAVFF